MLHKDGAGRSRILLGQKGEEIAQDFLKRNRVKIIRRNFKTPFGEIDLVCLDGEAILFVEVKTRISKSFGPPQLSVTAKKRKKLIQNAMCYLKRFGLSERNARIDVISISLNANGVLEKLEHIKSAVWLE